MAKPPRPVHTLPHRALGDDPWAIAGQLLLTVEQSPGGGSYRDPLSRMLDEASLAHCHRHGHSVRLIL